MDNCWSRWGAKVKAFFSHPFFQQYGTLIGLWIVLAIVAWVLKYFPGKYNNFLIFSGSFEHAMHKLPLYVAYPSEYFDMYLYGPVFALLIAPFSLMPLGMGLLTWLIAQAVFLWAAVRILPGLKRERIFFYWFCAHELLTALFMSQFNISIAALLIMSFAFIEKEKDGWAAFLIMLGTFTKLYGIVGLAFFFFSRHKLKFTLSCIGWASVLFFAPMLLWGADYVMTQYADWIGVLGTKNTNNLFALAQNVSFLGMVRKISGSVAYSDIYLILGGLILFALPYLRLNQYRHAAFRKTLLASVLLFVVLFSTGSESSTYIIALAGVSIWYTSAPWKRTGWDIALMVFAFILTSMSPSDLFPKYIRVHYVAPYALKALPCILVWLKLIYEMCFRDYRALSGETA